MEKYMKCKRCELTLNYRCNAKCMHCYIDNSLKTKNDMDFNSAIHYLYKSYKEGARTLALIGGEPTLYEKLIEVIASARKIGYEYILLLTNGIKLADMEYAKKLVENGLNLVKISLHSANPKKHDHIMGMKGAFKSFMKAVENINKLNIPCALDTVVFKENYQELPELVDFAFKQLNSINFNFVSCHYDGEAFKNKEKFFVSYSQQVPFLKEAVNRFKINGIRPPTHIFSNYPPCIMPGYEHLISDWKKNDDDLYLPDNASKPKKIIESLSLKRVKAKSCEECIYNEICIGIEKEYVKMAGGTYEFIPIISKPKPFPLKPIFKSSIKNEILN